MADVPTEVYYKIIVVGESGAGKTSFVRKLVHGAFTFAYKATIGIDFSLKLFHVDDDTVVRLQLYDIAGQERFGHMTRVYYKEACGALIVMDVSEPLTEALEKVAKWKLDIDSKVFIPGTEQPIPSILLANKADLAATVDEEQIADFCKANGITKYFLTSAKEGTNVEESGRFLVDYLQAQDTGESEDEDAGLQLAAKTGGKGCC